MAGRESTQRLLRDLAHTCALAATDAEVRTALGTYLAKACGARAVLDRNGHLHVLAGESLAAAELEPPAGADESTDCPVPPAWVPAGIVAVTARRLGDVAVIVAWDGAGLRDDADIGFDIAAAHLARIAAAAELADVVERVDNAQQLANMGDYDWNGATDTNRWSDQLYRIYGYEPQAFNASFERFMSLIHPDDRERIGAVIQRSLETGEPYEITERIVRPDGTIRFLSSNGQVVHDATGTPVRIRGTCVDVTDRVLADQERDRSATRFRELVEANPDAIVVVHADGLIAQANPRATELLGGDPVGLEVSSLIAWPEADGQDLSARGIDGRPLRLDVTTAELSPEDHERQRAAFLRDASPRLASEALAATLREAHVRRRQALELNDNVVQGLTAAGIAAGDGDLDACSSYLERTLDAARRLMDDWLDPLGGGLLEQGDLVRSEPSVLEPRQAAVAPAPLPRSSSCECRVLIVDDNEDLRTLARLQLEAQGCSVAGEAVDGVDAIAAATRLQPDVVLLDLAMPRMDGLEALPLLLKAVPGVRVVVMSGFDQQSLAPRLLETGAVRYIEKGMRMNLGRVVREVVACA